MSDTLDRLRAEFDLTDEDAAFVAERMESYRAPAPEGASALSAPEGSAAGSILVGGPPVPPGSLAHAAHDPEALSPPRTLRVSLGDMPSPPEAALAPLNDAPAPPESAVGQGDIPTESLSPSALSDGDRYSALLRRAARLAPDMERWGERPS